MDWERDRQKARESTLINICLLVGFVLGFVAGVLVACRA